MATVPKGSDPRVKRTRRLIQDAFLELLQEKGFAAISIQEITERATVNRGTFYAHFADKNALIEAIIREQFQQAVASMLPPTARWSRRSLGLLIQAEADFFQEMHSHCGPPGGLDPLLERAVQEELSYLLVTWLKQAPTGGKPWPVPVETLALVVSWAIFGVAVQWSQGAQKISAEQMANDALLVITEGVARLTPDGLPA